MAASSADPLGVAACGVFLELQAASTRSGGSSRRPRRLAPIFPGGAGPVVRAGARPRVPAPGVVGAQRRARRAGRGAGARPWPPRAVSAFNWLIAVAVTAVLFGLLFKVLPDVELTWPDVAVGGLVTAVLFTVGKQVIGLYLGQSGGPRATAPSVRSSSCSCGSTIHRRSSSSASNSPASIPSAPPATAQRHRSSAARHQAPRRRAAHRLGVLADEKRAGRHLSPPQ